MSHRCMTLLQKHTWSELPDEECLLNLLRMSMLCQTTTEWSPIAQACCNPALHRMQALALTWDIGQQGVQRAVWHPLAALGR